MAGHVEAVVVEAVGGGVVAGHFGVCAEPSGGLEVAPGVAEGVEGGGGVACVVVEGGEVAAEVGEFGVGEVDGGVAPVVAGGGECGVGVVEEVGGGGEVAGVDGGVGVEPACAGEGGGVAAGGGGVPVGGVPCMRVMPVCQVVASARRVVRSSLVVSWVVGVVSAAWRLVRASVRRPRRNQYQVSAVVRRSAWVGWPVVSAVSRARRRLGVSVSRWWSQWRWRGPWRWGAAVSARVV